VAYITHAGPVTRQNLTQWDAVAGAAAVASLAGLMWLGVLLLDQLVFFADAEQTRDAATARTLMLPAAGVAIAGAAVIGMRMTWVHAAAMAIPALVCVALTWPFPGAAYGLAAFPLTAPFAIAAATAVLVPAAVRSRRDAALVTGALLVAALVATSFMGILPLAVLLPAAAMVAWARRWVTQG
jgi:hypothetical protein